MRLFDDALSDGFGEHVLPKLSLIEMAQFMRLSKGARAAVRSALATSGVAIVWAFEQALADARIARPEARTLLPFQLLSVARTCSRLKLIFSDPVLWKPHVRNQWPEAVGLLSDLLPAKTLWVLLAAAEGLRVEYHLGSIPRGPVFMPWNGDLKDVCFLITIEIGFDFRQKVLSQVFEASDDRDETSMEWPCTLQRIPEGDNPFPNGYSPSDRESVGQQNWQTLEQFLAGCTVKVLALCRSLPAACELPFGVIHPSLRTRGVADIDEWDGDDVMTLTLGPGHHALQIVPCISLEEEKVSSAVYFDSLDESSDSESEWGVGYWNATGQPARPYFELRVRNVNEDGLPFDSDGVQLTEHTMENCNEQHMDASSFLKQLTCSRAHNDELGHASEAMENVYGVRWKSADGHACTPTSLEEV